MKKFLMCLLFLLMAGVSYGFSCDTGSDIDQKESTELSVDNTVSQNVDYIVAEADVIKSDASDEMLGKTLAIYSSNELSFANLLISGNLLEPDLVSKNDNHNLKNTNIKTELYRYDFRKARDGLQNG